MSKNGYEYIEICGSDVKNHRIINSVYSQLTQSQREEILDICTKTIIDKVPFSKVIWQRVVSYKNTSDYISKDVYEITFSSDNYDLLGNFIIFADLDSYEIISYASRD